MLFVHRLNGVKECWPGWNSIHLLHGIKVAWTISTNYQICGIMTLIYDRSKNCLFNLLKLTPDKNYQMDIINLWTLYFLFLCNSFNDQLQAVI